MFMSFHSFIIALLDLSLLYYTDMKFIKEANYQGQDLGNFQYKINKPKLLADIHRTGQDNQYK